MITQPPPKLEDYDIIDKIGVGSFSVVYKAVSKKTPIETFAIKCIEKRHHRASFADNIIKEISLLKFVNHENIVKLIDFSYNEKYIFIITEYCNEGDLAQFIRKHVKLLEPMIKTIIQQLALALHFLNQHSICHMDLKPQNLLIQITHTFKLKVADFGLAQIVDARKDNLEHYRNAGTICYMAPEKLLYQKFDSRIDLWSVGAIMYECYVGRPLYLRSCTSKDIIDSMVRRVSFTLPTTIDISPIAKDLLFSLLKYDPNERLGFEGFFNHEFIDLKHVPTPDNYLNTIKLVEEAIKLDEKKQYSYSLPKYQEAIKYLDAFINYENDLKSKKILMTKRGEYERWIYTLEKLINGEGSSSETLSQPLPKLSGNQYEMTKEQLSDNNVLQGIEYERDAEQYLTQGKKALALEKYKAALSLVLPVLNQETSNKRKEVIHTQVQKWLSIAEQLKRETD